MQEISIYTENNPYGYKYNINHPKVNELYRRYKVWKGYPVQYPLTDAQRKDFESYLDGLMEKKSGIPPGVRKV